MLCNLYIAFNQCTPNLATGVVMFVHQNNVNSLETKHSASFNHCLPYFIPTFCSIAVLFLCYCLHSGYYFLFKKTKQKFKRYWS